MAPTSEIPHIGDIEDWIIPNLTGDTHPIHLHLVQFILVSPQKFDVAKYNTYSLTLNAAGSTNGMSPWDNDYTPIPLDVILYLKGVPALTALNEQGWEDTF